MTIAALLDKIRQQPNSIDFNEVINAIAEHYQYTPSRFTNGYGDDQVVNDTGKNEGSCKLFGFAKLNGLNETETLACFGHHYRDDVLKHPDGSSHANIRTFMRHGWSGIQFDQPPLTPK